MGKVWLFFSFIFPSCCNLSGGTEEKVEGVLTGIGARRCNNLLSTSIHNRFPKILEL